MASSIREIKRQINIKNKFLRNIPKYKNTVFRRYFQYKLNSLDPIVVLGFILVQANTTIIHHVSSNELTHGSFRWDAALSPSLWLS